MADTDGRLQVLTLFKALCRRYPGRFQPGQLRTLQRRVRDWRVQYGPDREVYFEQVAVPGREAAFDFTDASDLGVTIRGAPFPHLLFEWVLSYSKWTHSPSRGNDRPIPSEAARSATALRKRPQTDVRSAWSSASRTKRGLNRPRLPSVPAARSHPQASPRSHPLTTSAPLRAQRGDRQEPVRHKRRPLAAVGSDASGSACRQTHPPRPTGCFSRHMS